MGVIDKIQAGVEKLTTDETRLNAGEITAIQQTLNAMQLGYVKNAFYLTQAQSTDVRTALEGLRDEFLEPNLERPVRIMEKAGIPYLNLNVKERVPNITTASGSVLRDEEVLLDTVLAMQATINGLQAGALIAVRGDVRDYFLNARDAAFDQWRKLGMITMRTMPAVIPPTMTGVTTK
jgi:hypothetical protein